MFLIDDWGIDFSEIEKGFNPLNQVYVFNPMKHSRILTSTELSFNPLNQVYVFNTPGFRIAEVFGMVFCFNPLNQVYVFNYSHAHQLLTLLSA